MVRLRFGDQSLTSNCFGNFDAPVSYRRKACWIPEQLLTEHFLSWLTHWPRYWIVRKTSSHLVSVPSLFIRFQITQPSVAVIIECHCLYPRLFCTIRLRLVASFLTNLLLSHSARVCIYEIHSTPNRLVKEPPTSMRNLCCKHSHWCNLIIRCFLSPKM